MKTTQQPSFTGGVKTRFRGAYASFARTFAFFAFVALCVLAISCGGGGGGGATATGISANGKGSPWGGSGSQSFALGFNKEGGIPIQQGEGLKSINWSSIVLTLYKDDVPTVYNIQETTSIDITAPVGTKLYATAVINAEGDKTYNATSDVVYAGSGNTKLTLYIEYSLTYEIGLTDATLPAGVDPTTTYTKRGKTLATPTYTAPAGQPQQQFMGWYLDDTHTTPANNMIDVSGDRTVYGRWQEGYVVFDVAAYDTLDNFEVETAEQLQQIADLVAGGKDFNGKTVTLKNDLNMDNTFKGIGPTPFVGTFDGGGYTVDVKITTSGVDDTGFISKLGSTGTVKNLTVTGYVTAANQGSGYTCAGIVGTNNGTIENCANKAAITGSGRFAAGIAGSNNNSINKCYNTGNITLTGSFQPEAGGISAFNYGSITNAYNTGAVNVRNTGDGYGDAAGITACAFATSANPPIVTKYCYNIGSISGVGNVDTHPICATASKADDSYTNTIDYVYYSGADTDVASSLGGPDIKGSNIGELSGTSTLLSNGSIGADGWVNDTPYPTLGF